MKGNITSSDQSTAVSVATTVCLVVLVLSPSMMTPTIVGVAGNHVIHLTYHPEQQFQH